MGLRRWQIAVPPGGQQTYDEMRWQDAIVFVERGVIELESVGGDSGRFGPGAVLCFMGLRLRLIRNCAREPALLIAVSRHR